MKLTQTYHNQATFTNQPQTSFRTVFASFASRHAQVFQSLMRSSTPYGGTIRPDAAHAGMSAHTGDSPHRRIAQLQQQVDELSQIVAQLSDQINTPTSAYQADSTGQIGLNRFRALKTNAC